MALSFIRTSQGNLNVVLSTGRSFHVGHEHPNYKTLLDAIKTGDEKKFVAHVDIPKAIAKKSGGLVEVVNGQVCYKGEVVHNVVANRILEFMNVGLPFQPLVNFLGNLLENPSRRSVEQLYTFLENKNLPITDDGCFLGYKAVRHDWKDKHSGKITNTPGTVVKVARSSVDDDFRNQCSYGLHVGGIEYVRSFGGGDDRFLIVKVNPKHAVAVPTDHQCQKLRVEEYLVVKEVSKDFVLENSLYGSDGTDYNGPTNEYYEDSDDYDVDDWYYEDVVEEDDDEEQSIWDSGYNAGYEQAKAELAKKQVVTTTQKRDSRGRFV